MLNLKNFKLHSQINYLLTHLKSITWWLGSNEEVKYTTPPPPSQIAMKIEETSDPNPSTLQRKKHFLTLNRCQAKIQPVFFFLFIWQ